MPSSDKPTKQRTASAFTTTHAAECDELLQAIKRPGIAYLLDARKALSDTNRNKRENNLRIDLIQEHQRSPFSIQELKNADPLAKEQQKQGRQAKRAANKETGATRASKRTKAGDSSRSEQRQN
ncbi:hypothetical protein OC844_006520 [Tilletia horrida]|nr:hypothetical protein OC844_006520 [Tilletia horrida]